MDSLRGVAAIIVFVYHCVFILAVYPHWLKQMLYSPLALLLYGGHQAVILFFVLSGFVLYLPYKETQLAHTYKKFVTRRICRIYLPYLASVLFSVIVYLLFFRNATPKGISALYGWRALTNRRLLWSLVDHVVFIGFFNRDILNGVTWSLAEEMRISLVFPLIAAAIQRWSTVRTLVVALAISTCVTTAVSIAHHRSPWETAHYGSLFALGALLAKNSERLILLWQRQGKVARICVLAISVLICAYAPALEVAHPELVREELADWLMGVTTGVFILTAVSEQTISKILRTSFLERFGRTSYGIYLFHLPILFILINLWWKRVPTILLDILALFLTLFVAEWFYRYIEKPSIALGRRITENS